MIIKEYTIQSADGLHARPATTLVRLAKKFKSSMQIKKDDKQIELNSLLNVLGLTLKYGDSISLIIEGHDEQEAAAAVEQFFQEQLKNL
ncbi:HPr family phosphocarrier protein [Daejeonella lutea]|uniref:Phosphocarrier protein n=1 Tax=Daejeonella lutea TaxID=572036 RepID=A0A1T5F7S9_9SPHI|nr:HPr family phosphocarrier protein [Daejeonella lutea]SKB92190.1 phosphocarrier protein [Daejeonella lutea]